MTCYIKIRTFAKTTEELWLDEWHNPLRTTVTISDPTAFLHGLEQPIRKQGDVEYVCFARRIWSDVLRACFREVYVDKITTGFFMWSSSVKAYRAVQGQESSFSWEQASRPALDAMSAILKEGNYFNKLALLWGQESTRNNSTPELRADNIVFMKSLGTSPGSLAERHLLMDEQPRLSSIDLLKLSSPLFNLWQ